MAGGMRSSRPWPTLAERARGQQTPAAATAGARHCWVTDPPDHPGRWPGLLTQWAQDDGVWRGLVAYAVIEEDRVVLVQTWLAAEHLASV